MSCWGSPLRHGRVLHPPRKIYLAEERGTPIPPGWAADADGVPTTDARAAIEGLILPMAGHKGDAISFMFDVLARVLTGSAFGAGVANPTAPGVEEIFVPGELEQRNAARGAAGITLPSRTWEDLSALAARSGVPLPDVTPPDVPAAPGTEP